MFKYCLEVFLNHNVIRLSAVNFFFFLKLHNTFDSVLSISILNTQNSIIVLKNVLPSARF